MAESLVVESSFQKKSAKSTVIEVLVLDGLKGTYFFVDVTFAPELTDSCTALAFRPPPCQDTERHTHAPVRQGL